MLFYNIFGQTIDWSTAKTRTSPKKRSNDLERSKFRQQVQSLVCVQPWRRVTFKFWEMLKNRSEVTLVRIVPKNIFFLKNFNFVQSFVECKVSLADGNLISYSVFHSWKTNWVFLFFCSNYSSLFLLQEITEEFAQRHCFARFSASSEPSRSRPKRASRWCTRTSANLVSRAR